MKLENKLNQEFLSEIKQIIYKSKQKAYTAINFAMVQEYWLIGEQIVVEEQGGEKRAEYGKFIIAKLSKELTEEFGRGYSIQSLKNFRQFYLIFKHLPISSTLWSQSERENSSTLWSRLSWSHYKNIMRVKNTEAREYYIKETVANSWSVRTLDRNISTQYYERLFLSHNKDAVKNEMIEKTTKLQNNKLEFIKSPSVLEFLNIPANKGYTENQLEESIINNLKEFLLELGKGYAFVERQQLIRTDTRDYFIDLVFYNYILKCFVLIDLKTERITHQDVGQMDMYVRIYDEIKKAKDDNPTIGIVLCSETDNDIARYSVLKGNEQIFASKYKLYLPTEDELKAEIEREKLNFKLQMRQKDE